MTTLLLLALSLTTPNIRTAPPVETFKSHDVLRTCAPSAGLCDKLGLACKQAGLPASECEPYALKICPGNRVYACDGMAAHCEAVGGDCDGIIDLCNRELTGCAEPKCVESGALSDETVIAFCFAHPARLDCDEDPSVNTCIELMTWGECGVTTCEWAQCMDDLADLKNTCPTVLPPSCIAVQACDEGEG